MCHCITPQALLSALVRRAAQGGAYPTRDELTSVLAVGCSRDEVVARFESLGEASAAQVRSLLATTATP